MRNRAQVFSVDFIIALMVFVVLLIASDWAWSTSTENIYFTEGRNDLELLARNAAAMLVQTTGNPSYWNNLSDFNTSAIYSLGLGKNRPWYIDEAKVARLKSLNNTNYTVYKTLLGIRGPGYEFHLNVSKFNGTAFNNLAIIGKWPNATAENVVRIERVGLSATDQEWIKLIISVWKTCSGATCY